MFNISQRSRILVSWLIVVGILLFVSGLIANHWVTISNALSPKPETFTELYFNDHIELPDRVYENIPFNISFTVHNLEHQPMTYPVKVYIPEASSSGEALPVFSGTLELEHDESETTQLEITVPALNYERYKMIVELENLNQNIHFWFQVASPSAEQLLNPTQ